MPDVLRISGAFRQGLWPEDREALNAPALAVCRGVEPSALGLRPHYGVSEPMTLSHAWPFPQLFRGETQTFLLNEATLYSVNENTWTTSLENVYTEGTPPVLTTIPAGGGPWHFVDFGRSCLFFNGATTVYRDEQNSKWIVEDTISISTGLNLWERMLFGGMTGWQTEWDSIASWISDAPAQVQTTFALDENTVMWSSVGAGDWLYIINEARGQTGHVTSPSTYDSGDPLFKHLLRRNQIGWVPMPWRGGIYRILPTPDGAVVYGKNGVAVLHPVMDPYLTFGVQKLAGFGPVGRGAVDGDESGHVFVDQDGTVWRFVPGQGLVRHGFRQQVYPMISNTILVVNTNREGRYYIGDGTNSYLLTGEGKLADAPQRVHSCDWFSGGPVGVATDNADTSFEVRTTDLDLGTRHAKQLHEARLGAASPQDYTIEVRYRSDADGSWTTVSGLTPARDGTVALDITCVEFNLTVTKTTYASVAVDYVDVIWSMGDRTKNIATLLGA